MKLNGPDSFKVMLHPSGWKILGDHNITFKWGEEHKLLRQSFLTLFTRKALNVYLSIQEGIIRRSIDEWLAAGGETDIRFYVRDMNVETSQMVFCGPYIPGQKERDEFNRHYQKIAEGFMSFPVNLPGTGMCRVVSFSLKSHTVIFLIISATLLRTVACHPISSFRLRHSDRICQGRQGSHEDNHRCQVSA